MSISKIRNNNRMKTILEICSFVLLLLCIAAILVCGVLLVKNNSEQSVVKYEIQLSVVPDTLGMLPKDVYVVVDSLQEYIKTSEQRIADKYEYFLEQKKDENVLFSVGSLFGGIFISILGFFGYKSFKDIELKAEKSATEIASETAEKRANEVALNASEEHLKNNLPKYVDEKLSGVANKLTNTVNTMIQERLEKIEEAIDFLYKLEDDKESVELNGTKQTDMDNLFW